MKKILTLMAAMSAASGAFAHDYNWTFKGFGADKDAENYFDGLAVKPTVQGTVNITKDGFTFAKGDANYVEFAVDADDVLNITATGLEGNIYLVTDAGTTTAEAAKGINHTFDNACTVKVYADPSVTITSVTVESKAYHKALGYIQDAEKAEAEAENAISKYVTDFSEFYNKVSAALSTEIANIKEQKAALAESKLNDQVAANNAAFETACNTIATNIKAVVTKAANKMAEYTNVTSDKSAAYKAANDAINKANGAPTSGTDFTNNGDKYIFNYGVYSWGSLNVNDKVFKTGWIESEYNKVVAEFEDAKEKAKTALATNYDGAYPTTEIEAKYTAAKTKLENILARAVYEDQTNYTYKAKTEAQSKAKDINSLATAIKNLGMYADVPPFSGVKNAEFKQWAKDAQALIDDLNSDDKAKYSASEVNAHFNKLYSTVDGKRNTIKAAWAAKGKELLDAKANLIQDKLDTYNKELEESYQFSADDLAKYKAAYAAQQVALNKAKEQFADGKFPSCVEKYADTNMPALESIATEVENIHGKHITDLQNETIAKNNTAKDAVDTKYNNFEAYYNTVVEKIDKKYRNIKGIAGDEEKSKDLDKYLSEMFDYFEPVRTMHNNLEQTVADLDKEYKKYDNTADLKTIEDYRAKVTAVETAAKEYANDAAYSYLTTDKNSKGTLPYAANQIEEVSKYAATVTAVKADAETLLKKIEADYYTTTKNFVDDHNTKKDLADQIDAVAEKLDPIAGLVADVKTKIDTYKAIADDIAQLRIDWTKAKAYKSENPDAANIIKVANDDIDQLGKDLKNDKLNADKATYTKKINDVKDQIWQVTNYSDYQANEKAYTDAKAALATAKAAVEDAKAKVNAVEDADVKAEYLAKLNAISFDEVAKSIEDAYAGKTSEAALGGQKAALETITANAKALAAEAEEKGNGLEGDQNNDKKLDGKDVSIIADGIANGTMTTSDYNNFLQALDKYNKNH